MSLSTCRRCGRPVVVDARYCTGCGLRNPAPSTTIRVLWIVILAAFALATLVMLFRSR